MRPTALRQALLEAHKFIEAGEVCLADTRSYGDIEYFNAGKDTGALRRASMDLTRTLAKLRGAK